MAINYGLLDTTIPAQLGALPGNTLATFLQRRQQMEDRASAREESGIRNELSRLQLTRGRRDMAEEDAYRNALAGVQGGDYAAAMPDLMKASPTRALALRKSMAEEQRSGLETTLKRFELIDRTAAQFAANPTRQAGVWVLSQLAANGTPPEVIQEMSTKLNATRDEDLPKMAQAFLAATREGAQAQIANLYPKPAAPTTLSRLLAERDALPPGDPRRPKYDAAIEMETTRKEPTPYFSPQVSSDGFYTFDARTGTWTPARIGRPVVPGAAPPPSPAAATPPAPAAAPAPAGPPAPAERPPLPAAVDPDLQERLAEAKARGAARGGATAVDAKREQSAENVFNILDEADKWVDKATSSYAGAARDVATRAVGASTEASKAAARLKALQGALMMAQPRMEGPQSDKDVQLYREMSGRIGDPTVPAAEKRAAMDTIRSLYKKYAPQDGGVQAVAATSAQPSPAAPSAPAAQPAGMDSMPPPAEHAGRTIRDSATGIRYRSDGRSWVRVE